VLATGVYFGSDPNGLSSAQGSFNSVASYSYPLDASDIQTLYEWNETYYEINPLNVAMWIQSAPSAPSTNYGIYDIITGAGNLQQVGSVTAISSTNVWITNVLASAIGGGTNNMRLQFTIQGGSAGVPYDTFVNSVLDFSTNTNKAWAWMGQGYQGNTYVITNLPSTACFLILGTPQSTAMDGLTDAYKLLVLKINPDTACTSGDGIADSDKILEGLNVFLSYPQWMEDSDNDGLPDAYESEYKTAFGLSPTVAEAPPSLPTYTLTPVP